jgi:hypothetical protein
MMIDILNNDNIMFNTHFKELYEEENKIKNLIKLCELRIGLIPQFVTFRKLQKEYDELLKFYNFIR